MEFERSITELLSSRSTDYSEFVSRLLALTQRSSESVLEGIRALPTDKLKELYDLLELVQDEADKELEHGHEFETFLLRVSHKTGYLPSRLWLEGVEHDPVAIGGGSSCDIYKGTLTTTGQALALKVPRLFMIEDRGKFLRDFRREALQWRQLRHKNIYPFLGLWDKMSGDRMCLISPWSSYGDLTKFLVTHPNHDRLQLTRDVAEGLQYLHGRQPQLVHGDLKAANILIDDNKRACISDFGISKFLQSHTVTTVTTYHKGTLRWMAPEQLGSGDLSKARSPASDMYSFAHVCFEIYTGTFPWPDVQQDVAVIAKVAAAERPERPDGIPDEIWNIIESCWKQALEDRLSASRVVSALADYREKLYLQPLSGLLESGEPSKKQNMSPEFKAAEKILGCLPEMLTTLDSLALADEDCADAVLSAKKKLGDLVQRLGGRPQRQDTVRPSGSAGAETDPAPPTRLDITAAQSPTASTASLPSSGSANATPPSFSPTPTSSSHATNQMSSVQYVTQLASQRHVMAEWPSAKTGPDNSPMWQVTCVVGGVPRATGFGTTVKLAKEQAAQRALESIDWDHLSVPSGNSTMPVSPVFTTLQYPPSSPTTALPQTAMHSRSQSLPVLSNAAFSMPSLPPTKGFLQFFNEEAARRRVVPNYSQVGGFTGEPHAPIWTFVVSINDEEKGRGSAGPSKQDAKEVAARQAYINMGWNVTGRV